MAAPWWNPCPFRRPAALNQPTLALFGTSADPPTRGHQALLEGLLQLYPTVATWASDNPLKQHGAPLEQRAALLGQLVAAIGNPRLRHQQELSSPWAITTLESGGRGAGRSEPWCL